MSLELFAQATINGLFIGFLFGLIGMGLTIIFGIMKVLNIATGAMIVLGAFTAYWMLMIFGINPLIGVVIAGAFGLIVGAIIYQLVVRRVVRAQMLSSLLALFGVMMVLENIMMHLWGTNPRSIPVFYPSINIGLVTISGTRAVVALLSIAVTLLLLALLKYTYLGRIIRATVQDWEAAILMGVDVNRVYTIGFALGVTLTFVAGALMAFIQPFEPFSGFNYTLVAFVVVVLGTLGNPVGCLFAGLIIGLVHSFTGIYWIPAMSPAVVYLVLIITFLVMPQGIMGRRK
ncbi:MAG: branched-chain amino acid ABC transporter permease [Candidatus Bathyarchaeota archaeon]|nr:branched-chain amino acid ABC transporter permease [Candidatus Bathyarchaeota archaeon]